MRVRHNRDSLDPRNGRQVFHLSPYRACASAFATRRLLDPKGALHASFLMAGLAAEVRIAARFVDGKRTGRFLARLSADLDWLWDAFGNVEVVCDLAAAVVQRHLDWLTGFGGQRDRVELH